MTFISYAQNFEDVILWRALKHVQNGFYIDVGAAWPDADSVTQAFYQNGWTGINIEPNPQLHSLYLDCRTRDINLNLAAGDCEGSILINFMSNPGLSTVISEYAEQHKSAGWVSDPKLTPITTLKTICDEHIKLGEHIHFLKIDVEGLEAAVLRGNDWTLYRPWVVLVEATLPMSQMESYEEWEHILITAGYIFVYADGLNRFYVSKEQSVIIPAFKYPPNVFDCFILAAQHQLESRAVEAESKAVEAETRAEQAEDKAEKAESKAEQAEAKAEQAEAKEEQAKSKALQAEARAEQAEVTLRTIYNSSSWKITAPFRRLIRLIKG